MGRCDALVSECAPSGPCAKRCTRPDACRVSSPPMSVSEWMSILSAAGHLALALLVLLRRTPSPMALPIALLALTQFGWNFAAFAYHHSGVIVWHYLDRGLSPLTPALAFHVICAFVGRARPLRYAIAFGYLGFASLVLWVTKPIWDNLFL